VRRRATSYQRRVAINGDEVLEEFVAEVAAYPGV
jgi:hypothetical protein